MPLALLFHHLPLNMFRTLVHPSSGACDFLWIYLVGSIDMVSPLTMQVAPYKASLLSSIVQASLSYSVFLGKILFCWLSVGGRSALSCLVAVTFRSPRSIRFSVGPDGLLLIIISSSSSSSSCICALENEMQHSTSATLLTYLLHGAESFLTS
jgi:hypothetical protein